jgi:hypothetical protein
MGFEKDEMVYLVIIACKDLSRSVPGTVFTPTQLLDLRGHGLEDLREELFTCNPA